MKKRFISLLLMLAMLLSLCVTTAMAAPAGGPPTPPSKESDSYTGTVMDYPDKELWFDSTVYHGFTNVYNIMKGNGDDTFDVDSFINSKMGELIMSRIKYEMCILGDTEYASEFMINYWADQGVIEKAYDSNDPTHEWLTFVPEYMYAKENAGKAYPVVFSLHGNGNTLFAGTDLGFVHICYQEGFMVVVPEAENEDQAYLTDHLEDYLDKMEQEGYPVDRSRVYVAGMSNGGRTALGMSLDCSDIIAAIAPHSSSFGMLLEGKTASGLLQGHDNTMEGKITQAQMDACSGMPIWMQLGESDMNQLPLPDGVIDSLNAWLEMNDCPTKAVKTDTNMVGITADKVYTQEIDGTNYTFTEFYNTDGVKTVVIVGIAGLPHWVSYSYPQLAWDFMKQYSIEDGKRVYTAAKTPKTETPILRDDGFYNYYNKSGELVKSDYVMTADKSLYFFNSKGIGVEIDYTKISDHVVQIFDNTNDSCFIIIGDEKAAVIDGMNGTVDLKKIASFFTDKPLVAVLTHGHGDHTGGVQSFDEVHLNEADFDLYKGMIAGSFRFGMIGYDNYLRDTGSTLDYTLVNLPEDILEENKELKLIPIADSEIFDLGGISIECIAAPGHTPGSMAMLIREDRIIVTGDAANRFTQVQGVTVEDYLKTLIKLKNRRADYDDIYSSHGALLPDGTNTSHMAPNMIDELIEGCENILNGKSEGFSPDPTNPYLPVRWAFQVNETDRRADGGCGNFMFTAENIWNTPKQPEPGPSTAEPTPNPAATYTVVKGDTLWGIAKKLYGSGSKWTVIYEANKAIIKNPNMIYAGQVLNIPGN